MEASLKALAAFFKSVAASLRASEEDLTTGVTGLFNTPLLKKSLMIGAVFGNNLSKAISTTFLD